MSASVNEAGDRATQASNMASNPTQAARARTAPEPRSSRDPVVHVVLAQFTDWALI